MFPYKLGCYRKIFLTEPVQVAVMDYTAPISDLASIVSRVPITDHGRADGVAIWVDYQLTSRGDILPALQQTRCPTDDIDEGKAAAVATAAASCENKSVGTTGSTTTGSSDERRSKMHAYDFPLYLTVNVKFFRDPVKVAPGSHSFRHEVGFRVGASDFSYDFSIESEN
jgi:hypothetical protein